MTFFSFLNSLGDAPKSGEIIELDKVYELRAKYCRGYPLFMKKYDQPIRDSNSILNKLFLRARRQLFMLHDPVLRIPPPQPLVRSQSATPKARAQRKTGISAQDKEFQKWRSSLNIHGSDDNISEPLPVLKNSSVTKKPSRSVDADDKMVDTKSSEPSIEQPTQAPKKRTRKVPSKKEEEEEVVVESEPFQASLTKEKRTSIDIKSPGSASAESEKPKQTKKKSESTGTLDTSRILINSAAPCDTSKSSASASSFTVNILNRDIVFNGMKTVTNRLKWNQSGNDTFTVDLDTNKSDENNAVDKLVQLMLDSSKSSPFPANTKLTLVISWGELYLKILQATDDNKPKNIKELNQRIKENNDIEFSFREHDIKTVTEEHKPSKKSTAEYVLVCKYRGVSSSDLLLIFDDKKKLKKISFISTWWICAVRGDEELMDSFYEIRCTSDEIDSKHESFSDHLRSIFNDSKSIDLLSGTSPRISIANELLKPTVQIVSLRRLIRCEYASCKQRELDPHRFDTLTNFDSAFYEVTHISTEEINGSIQTRDTIEFYVTHIQIAKKYEKDLKQLFTLAEDFFD